MFRAYHRLLVARPLQTQTVTAAAVIGLGDCVAQYIEHITSNDQKDVVSTQRQWYQPNRTGIMTVWGAFFGGYFAAYFRYLDTKPFLAAKTPRNIAIRVVSIWFIAQPVNLIFFVYIQTAEHFIPIHRAVRHDVKATTAAPLLPLVLSEQPLLHDTTVDPVSNTLLPLPPLTNDTTLASPSSFAIISEQVLDAWRNRFPLLAMNGIFFWIPVNSVNMILIAPLYRPLFSSFASVIWNTYLSLVAHK